MWNPFRSKLAAAILGGMDKIHIKPGSKVLYLGAASGTTVSHVADIVGPVSALMCENVAMKLQPSRPPLSLSPHLAFFIFFTISVHNSINASLVHPSPFHLITIHYLTIHPITISPHHQFTITIHYTLLHPITSSLITTSPITTRAVMI